MIIKTKNFALRPFKKGDEASLQKSINNKEICRNLAVVPFPYTMKDAKEWVGENIKESKNKSPKMVNFVIDIQGEVAGSIGLHKIEKSHKAELGYWIAEKYWGQGIMTQSLKLITMFGFKELKLKRIWAAVFAWNKGSMRVLKKSGYKLEGVLRNNTMKNGKLLDDYIFAKTKK